MALRARPEHAGKNPQLTALEPPERTWAARTRITTL